MTDNGITSWGLSLLAELLLLTNGHPNVEEYNKVTQLLMTTYGRNSIKKSPLERSLNDRFWVHSQEEGRRHVWWEEALMYKRKFRNPSIHHRCKKYLSSIMVTPFRVQWLSWWRPFKIRITSSDHHMKAVGVRDQSKFCAYRCDHGRNIDKCQHLKALMKDLITTGKLKEFIRILEKEVVEPSNEPSLVHATFKGNTPHFLWK